MYRRHMQVSFKEVLISTLAIKLVQGGVVVKLETNSGAPAAIEQPAAPAPVAEAAKS